MLLGSSGVGNKLHGFGKTIRNESAGRGVGYAVSRGEKIAKEHNYQLL